WWVALLDAAGCSCCVRSLAGRASEDFFVESLGRGADFFFVFDFSTSVCRLTGGRISFVFELGLSVSATFLDLFPLGFSSGSSSPFWGPGALAPLAAFPSVSLRKSAARFRDLCLDLIAVSDPLFVIVSSACTDMARSFLCS